MRSCRISGNSSGARRRRSSSSAERLAACLTPQASHPLAVRTRDRWGLRTTGNGTSSGAGSPGRSTYQLRGAGTPSRVAVRMRSTLSFARAMTSAAANGTRQAGSNRWRWRVTRLTVMSVTGTMTSTPCARTAAASASTAPASSSPGSGWTHARRTVARGLRERRAALLRHDDRVTRVGRASG